LFKKIVSEIMFVLLLTSMVIIESKIQPIKAWAGTVYIRADGSVDPSDAPIITYDNITYTLTDNTTSSGDGIVVERSNMIIEGAGYTLQGAGSGRGIGVLERSNITIRNMQIRMFGVGISLLECANGIISGNNITNNGYGVWLFLCGNGIISGNNITNNSRGIYCDTYVNNIISENNISNNYLGMYFEILEYSIISGNNILNNDYGMILSGCEYNDICHNNFINNTDQVGPYASEPTNIWDGGYPSGGNYWSDYNGTDANTDGIGDTPYVIDENNQDRYPLMAPFGSDVALINIIPSKTVVGQGYSTTIKVTVQNQGFVEAGFTEALDISVYADDALIGKETGSLVAGAYSTITFTWNTSGFAFGNYTLWAYVPPVPGETYTGDNTFIYGPISMTIFGDTNGDGTLNFQDAIVAGLAFGSKLGDSNWNPNTDLNEDEFINFLDVILMGQNFGQSWT
jgi:parallel beta-helix repeat protein